MAPLRRPQRPREALPSSERCCYVEGDRRCRRIATINGELCRHHAIRLELELEEGHPLDEVIGAVDRRIAQSPDLFIGVVANAFGKLFGRRPQQPQQQQQQRHPPPRARARPQPPRPQAAKPPDPALLARELLGFEPAEPLTIEIVQKRKQALARVFHPDMPGGSEARMKRVNAAADLLLAKLAK